jgi:hypothetical protein
MPIIDVEVAINDQEVCIALFNGTLVNNNVTVQQTTYDITIRAIAFAGSPESRYLRFINATGGTVVRLQWDTAELFLAYQANANGGSSTLRIGPGAAFPILSSQCPGDPAQLSLASATKHPV